MAQFIGTVQEFHHYIGPRIRNAIKDVAAPFRKKLGGICQECGKQAELQSAHVHGRDRRVLIEAVLTQHTGSEGAIRCDLESVERQIIEAHMPIEETFRFICQSCHVVYDAGAIQHAPRGISVSVFREAEDSQFTKLNRIERWASHPNQANHQMIRAFLRLEQSGEVTLPAFRDYCEHKLQIVGFDGKYASMKTDAGNSYGKVFFDEGGTVKMWPIVRQEVVRYF